MDSHCVSNPYCFHSLASAIDINVYRGLSAIYERVLSPCRLTRTRKKAV